MCVNIAKKAFETVGADKQWLHRMYCDQKSSGWSDELFTAFLVSLKVVNGIMEISSNEWILKRNSPIRHVARRCVRLSRTCNESGSRWCGFMLSALYELAPPLLESNLSRRINRNSQTHMQASVPIF